MLGDDELTPPERISVMRAGLSLIDKQLDDWLHRLNANELRDIPTTRHVCKTYEAVAALRTEVNELEKAL